MVHLVFGFRGLSRKGASAHSSPDRGDTGHWYRCGLGTIPSRRSLRCCGLDPSRKEQDDNDDGGYAQPTATARLSAPRRPPCLMDRSGQIAATATQAPLLSGSWPSWRCAVRC